MITLSTIDYIRILITLIVTGAWVLINWGSPPLGEGEGARGEDEDPE